MSRLSARQHSAGRGTSMSETATPFQAGRWSGAASVCPTRARPRKRHGRKTPPARPALLPSHMNAAQYTAIVSGLLARNEDLAVAAIVNPASFIAAMADCARLEIGRAHV